ncbi:MAG: aldo/keto reductase [Verrucomicrobia bacterium]|nr:aldo/keto reductase [Verrucomicrobiota bacterium]MBS0645740.1 aldo/keto reductase [Verrucomicrobiota bacterium]
MQLPQVGLGTWELRGEECIKIVKLALELGYRHIDTAYMYQNHQDIYKAMVGFPRDQIYLTSKISVDEQVDVNHIQTSVFKACEQALKELKTDYLDLYLIHWPCSGLSLEEVFVALQQLVEKGKVREVGVSNYNLHYLQDLLRSGGQPYANQVEFHPYLYQKDLQDYCSAHHIKMIAFRPFGKGKLLREEPLFAQIGEKYNKTGAQVILRWLIQKHIYVVPKASSKKHLKENLEIFDFVLNPSEIAKLDHLHKNKRYCGEGDSVYDY